MGYWLLHSSQWWGLFQEWFYGPLCCVVCICVLAEVGLSQHTKLVYRCQVLGGKGCGKSSFIRGLVGKEMALVPEELQEEEAMSIKALTLPSSTSPVYLLVRVPW